MLDYIRAHILDAVTEDYVVVPVNSAGSIKTAIQHQWADDAPPEFVRQYRSDCRNYILEPGHVLQWKDSSYILAVTTSHWATPSRLDWIDDIAQTLALMSIREKWGTLTNGQYMRKSVALPLLGAGWFGIGPKRRYVREILEHHLKQVPTLFNVYTR